MVLFFAACSDEQSNGRVKIYLTDAPVDGSQVDALFLSITKIELKGSSGWTTLKEFSTPLSIDILDYQNGNSFFVTEETLKADTYTEVRLIVQAAEAGSSPQTNPGCFLQMKDGTRKELFVPSGGQSGYKVKGAFTLPPDGTVAVTLDFDARKSVVATGNGRYLLKPTVRLIANQDAALIEGKFAEHSAYAKTVVYAYAKGTFDINEAETPASGETRFSNAITSTALDASGNFKLAFLEPGDYELVFAAHAADGEFVDVIGKYENATVTSGARLQLALSLSLLIRL